MSNVYNDKFFEQQMENEDELHYEQVMAERQERIDRLRKHNCICPNAHGEVLRSCPNMLLDGSVCDTCIISCVDCEHPSQEAKL